MQRQQARDKLFGKSGEKGWRERIFKAVGKGLAVLFLILLLTATCIHSHVSL